MNRIQGGFFRDSVIGSIGGLASIGATIFFVDTENNALRYISHSDALKSLLQLIREYASCWGLTEGNHAPPFTEALSRLKSIQQDMKQQEAEILTHFQVNKIHMEDDRLTTNFWSVPFRKIIDVQVLNLQLYVNTIQKLQQQRQNNNTYQQMVLPDMKNLTLASVTTLPIEHMFADLSRKHRQVSMVSFAQHWPSMLLETVKKVISPAVLGYHIAPTIQIQQKCQHNNITRFFTWKKRDV